MNTSTSLSVGDVEGNSYPQFRQRSVSSKPRYSHLGHFIDRHHPQRDRRRATATTQGHSDPRARLAECPPSVDWHLPTRNGGINQLERSQGHGTGARREKRARAIQRAFRARGTINGVGGVVNGARAAAGAPVAAGAQSNRIQRRCEEIGRRADSTNGERRGQELRDRTTRGRPLRGTGCPTAGSGRLFTSARAGDTRLIRARNARATSCAPPLATAELNDRRAISRSPRSKAAIPLWTSSSDSRCCSASALRARSMYARAPGVSAIDEEHAAPDVDRLLVIGREVAIQPAQKKRFDRGLALARR